MIWHLTVLAAIGTALAAGPGGSLAADIDEFKVKRQEVFEFTEKPRVARDGDKVTITFASKAFCDATVAIEDPDRKILRHLASGVLGKNAPSPFQKNALKQTIVWDGKDDQGKYVDDKDAMTVRVSLGLKPQFERTLFWSPKKRWSSGTPLVQAAPEGVYVFDNGGGVAQLRLFGHDGNYVRTVYPFPADKLGSFKDLKWHESPQDGRRLPRKLGGLQATLLSSGNNADFDGVMGIKVAGPSTAATAMAVRKGRMALVHRRLNRLAADGSSGGLKLEGSKTSFTVLKGGKPRLGGGKPNTIGPSSIAFSPDGEWLYMTGYFWKENYGSFNYLHGVVRMKYAGDAEPELFAGSMKQGFQNAGKDAKHLKVPTSIACDAKGRVYVADYMNDRIQVFQPDGKLLKTIKVAKPAQITLHHRTNEIYVFSWLVADMLIYREKRKREFSIEPKLTLLGPLEQPREIASYPLPLRNHPKELSAWDRQGGRQYSAALDSWADPPTVWLVPSAPGGKSVPWENSGLLVLEIKGGKLALKKDFGQETKRAVVRAKPPPLQRQRLYVNPADGNLYVADGGKVIDELLRLDPESGRIKLVKTPFGAEDMAFDINGLVYLRTLSDVGRFDPKTWREVPWDYGEQRGGVRFMGGRGAPLISSLPIPCKRLNHQGGMMVSPKGHLVVSNHGPLAYGSGHGTFKDLKADEKKVQEEGKPYTLRLYPGRSTWGLFLVFDKHGKVVYDDAVPGVELTHGIGIDKNDNLYALAMGSRILDGKKYFNEATDTLIKVKPGRTKVYSSNGAKLPLTDERRPKRPPDITGRFFGTSWWEGAEWFYGGVGFNARNRKIHFPAVGCDCWNARFDLDYFARSFAPELGHYSVAVLDTNGNLILRIGTYGNVDDGKPLVAAGGPPNARSIGGDEVSLFYAPYVATHSDRRLFIADAGNARIVSVKLGYHTTEKVALKSVTEEKK